jgi:hypothetical protein
MSFTTDALLYPLTKGDVKGHDFHGNQYETVGGEGKTNTPRPPAGQFQFTTGEIKKLAELTDGNKDGIIDRVAVGTAKILEMDNPAQRVSQSPNGRPPQFYRGCDNKGALSLVEPLQHYNIGKGGMASGAGVYATRDINVANEYSDGVVVKMWLDPTAKVCTDDDTVELSKQCAQQFKDAFDRGDITESQFKILRIEAHSPSFSAMAFGYQAVDTPDYQGGQLVVLDRSILKVQFDTSR